ncbi:MAG: hypothetical protein P8M62_09255 [Opitutae bacterium]|nr:hypothetical protein [Opitutae bacterium]
MSAAIYLEKALGAVLGGCGVLLGALSEGA